jgi:predicted outer membrane repeat protein
MNTTNKGESMKIRACMAVSVLSLWFVYTGTGIAAGTKYVSLDGGNTPPYTNWATAAHVIQDAVDAALDDDIVLVSNGIYTTGLRVTPGLTSSNRVVITNDIVVRSLNGPESVCIMGAADLSGDLGLGPGAVRCVYMDNGTLEGLTLSNGHTTSRNYNTIEVNGGGVYFATPCLVSNCIVAGNHALYGGGLYGHGRLLDSTISGNEALAFGGGLYADYNCKVSGCVVQGNRSYCGGGLFAGSSYDIVSDCTISGNYATSKGGGVYSQGQLLDHCLIAHNTSDAEGGGAYLYGGALNRCIISANRAATNGGGVFGGAGSQLTNCLVAGNNVADYGGGMYVNGGGVAINCTISSNSANIQGGGVYFSYGGILINTIIYHNSAGQGGANWHSTTNANTPFVIRSCCTTPTNGLPIYSPCVSDPPLFCAPGSDYHLLEGSPCIDAGFYMPWARYATDLDGNPRWQGDAIDIGCYETVPEPFGALATAVAQVALMRRRAKWSVIGNQ